VSGAGSQEEAERGGDGVSWRLCVLTALLALLATAAARGLLGLIGAVGWLFVEAREHSRLWTLFGPALGGLGVGLIARYGTRAVIGHGIPEVMQQVLANRSRVPPRTAFFKPLASALAIGSGGPFGAEGPVISLGGSVGSLLGQALPATAGERKTLLAAGAAAGMTAVFGTPLAATLLSIELLLFEFRPRSALPVALAAVLAEGMRFATGHGAPEFVAPSAGPVDAGALAFFAALGVVGGAASTGVARAVHALEKAFERCPGPWFLRPAFGGLFVGAIAWFLPAVLGPGYGEIDALLAGELALGAAALLCLGKLAAWTLALGSGTSGGTLAPMLLIGGAAGATASRLSELAGFAGVPGPGVAALVGMAAFFAGGSRALFATVALGVEMTGAPGTLTPLLAAAVPAVFTAHALARHSLMSGPVESGGVRVPGGLATDAFEHISVREAMSPPPRLPAGMTVRELAGRIAEPASEHARHAAWVIVDEGDKLTGIVTRSDILAAVEGGDFDRSVVDIGAAPVVTAFPDEMLDVVLARMHARSVGRVAVVSRQDTRRVEGYLGRAAIIGARSRRWEAEQRREPGWWSPRSAAAE
jgi:chloride channel protein, CIC family